MSWAPAALAAALAALLCLDGGLSLWTAVGRDTFGRPTLLGPLSWLLAALLATAFARNRRRLPLARTMVLVVTGLCLFGGSVVPALPGLAAAFCGATLWVAAPWIRLRTLGWTTVALAALCLPACLTTRFPGGVPSWLLSMAPHVTVALALPGLLPGRGATRAAQVVVAVSTLVCLAGLISYPLLAWVLDLPLISLSTTRLHLLGHHPNLAVPGLTLAIVLAASLASRSGARWERWALLPLLAALTMIASRTGWLTAIAGLSLLALLRLAPRQRQLVRGVALAVVCAALLLPALGLTDRSINHESSQTLTKAVTFRASMWRLGRATLAAAPWTGNGPGTSFLQNARMTRGRYDVLSATDHPHNTTLAVGAAFGWPGLTALGLLLLLTLRRPQHATPLADAASAALFVTWAANGIDMGGATATLFPSSAFLLAALKEASGSWPDDGDPQHGVATAAAAENAGDALSAAPGNHALSPSPDSGRLPRWIWTGLGTLLIVAGLGRAAALWTLRDLGRSLAAQPVAQLSDQDREALDVRAARAARWLPGDHRIPLLRSTLAGPDADRAARFLARARELAPDLAQLAHRQALQLSRRDIDDPRVFEWLNEAERLAPFGPEAWRLHMDMAGIAAHNGDATRAFAELMAALRLSPLAVTRARFDARRRILRLDAGRHAGVDIPLDDVLAALEEEALQLQASDPAYATRLHLAQIQTLTLLGEAEQAEADIQRFFPDQPEYALQQRSDAAIARGDFDTALTLYRASGPVRGFQTAAQRLLAQAQAGERDDVAYAAAMATAIDWLPDVIFEHTSVATMLRARRHWAGRIGDALGSQRVDHALTWIGN